MLDLNHTLYFYGSGSGATYSDLNGFSPYLSRLFWYKLYWGSFAVFLALLSNLFWKRGLIGDIRSRLRKAIQRLTPILKYNLGLFIVLFIGAGSYIFYNTNILNDYHPREHWEQQSADGEKAYKKYEPEEYRPGIHITDDEELVKAASDYAQTIFHPVGTCKMGNDDMAVVDDSLRVKGIQNLRVIDASIMPNITSGNTNAPTIMIAEKGADMILNG